MIINIYKFNQILYYLELSKKLKHFNLLLLGDGVRLVEIDLIVLTLLVIFSHVLGTLKSS